MGSASRPHRQARSAKASYKSEDEDFVIAEATHTKPSESKDPTRRNLNLKRISRSQERAEALQLQRAIDESLSKGTVDGGTVSFDASDHAREVIDSEDEVPSAAARTADAGAFQCLLDVASEAGFANAGPSQEVSESMSAEEELSRKQADIDEIPLNGTLHGGDGTSRQGVKCVVDPEDGKNKETSGDKKLKVTIQEDVDWSCEEEDDDEEDATEDESSDVSEDSGCKRKRPVNSQQKGKKAAGPNDKTLTAQVKKARSARPVSKAKALLSAKKRSSPEPVGVKVKLKPAIHVKLADANPTSYTSTTNEAPEKHASNSKELKETGKRGGFAKVCQTAHVIEPRRLKKAALFDKASLFDNASCESSGILNFQAQSPTLLHRRVIGLSRRFRPPPLHPYLSKMEG